MKKTFFSLMAFAVLFCLALTGAPRCLAQKPAEAPLKWFDPLEAGPVVHGVGWDELRSGYVRLPEKAHGVVRNEVWGLSRNAAGLSLVFESDASEILVIYGVEGTPGMFHMPGTGKSGVDLYATDRDGKVRWVAPDFPPSFRDTIRYIYSNITYHPEGATQYEYHLYLPLYNTITWLKIGIPQEAQIRFLPESAEKPLVVYGTSIGQGACASRAGNCWTGIVERETRIPLINLAFSGNGRLEPEVLELLAEIDARAYILDCTPNLTHAKDIEPRLLEAVRILGLTKKTKIYQASTSELYGKVEEVPQSETTPFHPYSPYAVAKQYAFWMTREYREAYGMFACNGILFNHESERRGETFVTRKITLAWRPGALRKACRTIWNWATWTASGTGATPKTMWSVCG